MGDFLDLIFWIFRNQESFTEANKIALSIYFKTFLNSELASRRVDADQRAYIFNALIELVMSPRVITQSVIVQLVPPIENILFFDGADSFGNLVEQVFEPIKEGLKNPDPEVLRSTLLVLRSATAV
jgi:hypothetical protein